MTALVSYSTGTVSVLAGGTVVTGVGTVWSGVNARPGDWLQIGSGAALITDVTDITHLVITPWGGTTQTTQPYAVYQESPQRFAGAQAMADVSAMMAALNTNGYFVFVDSTLTVPDPSLGNNNQFAFQPSTGKLWTKTAGVWVLTSSVSGSFAGGTAGQVLVKNSSTNYDVTWSTPTALATNVQTFLTTPSSANLAAAITDETGTAGAVVFSAGPSISDARLTGQTRIGANVTPDATVVINGNTTATAKAPLAGTLMHIVGAAATIARVVLDGFGSGVGPVITARHAQGTAAAPTTTQSGNFLGGIAGVGYGATDYVSNAGGAILFAATQNFTDTAAGTSAQVYTVPNGAVANAVAATFQQSGGLSIGTAADPGIGSIGITGQVKGGSLAPTLAAATGPAVDFRGITVTLAAGASAPLYTASYGTVVLIHNATSGAAAIYLMAQAQVLLIGQIGSEFVASTTTPTSTHSSIAYDGVSGFYRLYDNVAGTSVFSVGLQTF